MNSPAHKLGPSGLALRIGLLEGRTVTSERILRRPTRVTVGQSTRNDLTLPTDALPKSYTLFELRGDQLGVWLADGMDGRVSPDGTAVHTLDELRLAAREGDGVRAFVPLGKRARGKIRIGVDAALLFQIVQAPARLSPPLPAAVRGTLLQKLDLALAAFLAVSLSAHLGFAGYVGSLPAPLPPRVDEVPDRFVRLIVPKPPQKPRREEPRRPDAEAAKKATRKREQPIPLRFPDPASTRKLSEVRKEHLREQVAKTGLLKILGAQGGQGALDDLVGKGAPATDQDRAFAGLGGVTDPSAAGPLRNPERASTGRSISADPMRGGGVKEAGTATAKTEREVRGVAKQEVASVEGELDQAQVMAEIRKRNGAIRRCYEKGLKKNPTLHGKLTVRFQITGAGTVAQVTLPEDDIGDPEVAACVTGAVRTWRFPAGGASATVEVPFVFSSSQ